MKFGKAEDVNDDATKEKTSMDDRLILRYAPLAKSIAWRFYRGRRLYRWHTFNDVLQEAMLAIVEAGTKCDTTRSAKVIGSYLKRCIYWRLLRMTRESGLIKVSAPTAVLHSHSARLGREMNEKKFLSYDEINYPNTARNTTAEDAAILKECVSMLRFLPPQEKETIIAHFGLDGAGGKTLKEMSEEKGVSCAAISLSKCSAIRRLRHIMEKKNGDASNG